MTPDEINAIVAKLNEARSILQLDIPMDDDMDVTEWNASPVGRASRRIGDAIDLLTGEE